MANKELDVQVQSVDQMLERIKRVLKEFRDDLTPQEIEALSYLLLKGKLTANEANSIMGVDIARAYTVLDNLVNKKLVKKVENRTPKVYLPLHPHYIFSELERRLATVQADIQAIMPHCEQIFETSQDFVEPSLGDFLYTSEEMSEIVSDLAPILKSATEIIIAGEDASWIDGQSFLLERMKKTPLTLYLNSPRSKSVKTLANANVTTTRRKLSDFLIIKTGNALHFVLLIRKYRPDGTYKMHGIRLVDQQFASYMIETLREMKGERK